MDDEYLASDSSVAESIIKAQPSETKIEVLKRIEDGYAHRTKLREKLPPFESQRDADIVGPANHLLLSHSFSLQRASIDAPRALAHTQNGSFWLANSAHDREDGKTSDAEFLEAIDFKSQPPSLVFLERHFPPSSSSTLSINSPKCLSCHGVRTPHGIVGKFLWQPGPIWNYVAGDMQTALRQNPRDDPKSRLAIRIEQAFDKDRKQNSSHLEKALKEFQYSFWRNDKFDLTSSSLSIAALDPTIDIPAFDIRRATDILSFRQYQVMAYELSRYDDFEKYRWALLGALYNCEDPVSFFIPKSSTEYRKAVQKFDVMAEETKRRSEQEYLHRLKIARKSVLGSEDISFAWEPLAPDSTVVAKTRFVLNEMGVALEDWSMSPEPGSLVFGGSDASSLDHLRHFIAHDISGLPEHLKDTCDDWASESRKNFTSWRPSKDVAKLPHSSEHLLEQCASCHDTGLDSDRQDKRIPYIPFNHPAKFEEALMKNNQVLWNKIKARIRAPDEEGDNDYRMPLYPIKHMTDDEAKDFEEFLLRKFSSAPLSIPDSKDKQCMKQGAKDAALHTFLK